MQNSECGVRNAVAVRFAIPNSTFRISNWGRRRDLHSRGAGARQFTKLLLSLLSHTGENQIVGMRR